MATKQCAIDLLLTFETQQNSHFDAMLFRLIAKADRTNRRKIAAGFPDMVAAYEEWCDAESPRVFYDRHLSAEEQRSLKR